MSGLVPAPEGSFQLSLDNGGFGHQAAIRVPFLPQAVGKIILEELLDLDLSVRVPALGKAVQHPIRNRRAKERRTVRVLVRHPTGVWIRASGSVPAAVVKLQVAAEDLRGRRIWLGSDGPPC